MAQSNGGDSRTQNDPPTISVGLHHQELLRGLDRIRTDHRLSDVTIVVGNKQIHAHKFVLSAMSPYFMAMFSSDMKESKERNVYLHDLNEEAVEMILDFFYTSHIKMQNSNVQALLAASSLLQVPLIQTKCCDYLRNNLDPTNCLGIIEIADKYSRLDLVNPAIVYARNNFEEVAKNEEFLRLPVDRLIELISADTLDVIKEEKVYEAVVRWTGDKDFPEDRNIHLDSIIEHVRFSQMNMEYLVNLRETSRKLKEYIEEAKDYLILSYKGKQVRDYMCGPRFRKRAALGESLYAVLGFNPNRTNKMKIVKSLGLGTDKWTFISELLDDKSYRRSGIQMVALNGALYFSSCRSTDKNEYHALKSYDPTTDKWNKGLAQIKLSKHSSAELIALNGYLYLIGYEQVDRYDPVQDKWFQCARLNYYIGRSGFKLAVIENCIYVIGGYTKYANEDQSTQEVERYDPGLNEWQSVASMKAGRRNFGCVACNGYIYVMGGERQFIRTFKSVERYDPKTDSWDRVASMSKARSSFKAVAMNGLIFIFESNCLRSVEVYDTEKNIWSTRAQTADDDYYNVDEPKPDYIGLAVVERQITSLST